MIVHLTPIQIGKLADIFQVAEERCPNPFEVDSGMAPDNRGVVMAQVYPTFMKVSFVENRCAKKIVEILRREELLFRKFT